MGVLHENRQKRNKSYNMSLSQQSNQIGNSTVPQSSQNTSKAKAGRGLA